MGPLAAHYQPIRRTSRHYCRAEALLHTKSKMQDAGSAIASTSASGAFRLCSKSMFFTWPKEDKAPSVVLASLMATLPGIEKALVVQEKHEDGDMHLHAAIWFTKRKDIKGLATLNSITGKQGNYQRMKSAVDCVRYLLKDNGLKASHPDNMDWERFASKKRPRKELFTDFTSLLKEGKGLDDMWDVDPGFVAGNLQRLEYAERWYRGRHHVHRVPHQAGDGRSIPWMVRTLVLVGQPGAGKSYWGLNSKPGGGGDGTTHSVALSRGSNQLWWNGYIGQRRILIDEFEGKSLTVTAFNRITDDKPLQVEVKGGFVNADWVEVVVTTNNHPRKWWPKISDIKWASVSRRIHVVEFKQSMRALTWEAICLQPEYIHV